MAEKSMRWADGFIGVDWGTTNRRAYLIDSSGKQTDEFEDAKVAYAIIEADTHDEAVRIVGEHPHLTLIHGNSIEVIECATNPGRG